MSEPHSLSFGKLKSGDTYDFSYDVRMENMAFFGKKGSGKDSHILPMIANEQLEKENEGALFVINTQKLAWNLYALAKKYHREVVFLSPSAHEGMKELINLGILNSDTITDKLVDFSKAMKRKAIIIINAEPYKYQERAIELTGSILMRLQMDLHLNTHDTPFFVYIDDGDTYLPYAKDLLTYGEQFGVGSVMFFHSREYMKSHAPLLSYFIETHIRTTILMNGLVYEDALYFNSRFFGSAGDESFILKRNPNELIAESTKDGVLDVQHTFVRFLSESLYREIEEEATQLREKNIIPSSYSYSIAKKEELPKTVKRTKPRKKVSKPKSIPTGNKIFITEDDLFN